MINISALEFEAYNELQCYTLEHGGNNFIHQHVVDAWSAQHADENTKPIRLAFALIGLSFHLEKKMSGREVQRMHMEFAKKRRSWPSFELPADRGEITAIDVMNNPAGLKRDKKIDEWCISIWNAYKSNHQTVAKLIEDCLKNKK